MLLKGVTVIDVGITRMKSDQTKSGWKLFGDVDFESCQGMVSFITPVPGGVGPMTIAMLLKHIISCSEKNILFSYFIIFVTVLWVCSTSININFNNNYGRNSKMV